MLAALSSCPEIDIGTEKSARLAEAVSNATRNINLPELSPERMALAMLVWTAGRTYVPVALAIRARLAAESQGQAPPAPPGPTPPGFRPAPDNPVDPHTGGSWTMPDAASIN